MASPAQAVSQCAGFADVLTSDNYCPAVQWMQQRSITVGCTDTAHFCPAQTVTRASMALFMKRMSDTVQPQFQHVTDQGIVETVNVVACQTPDFDVGGYVHVATAQASASVWYAAASASLRLQLVYSTDAGATWNDGATNWTSTGYYGRSAAASSLAVPQYFQPHTLVRYGLKGFYDGTIYFFDCELQVRYENYNGALF